MLILLILFLLPLSLIAMFPSFYLGLYGDDWLEIWRFFYETGTKTYGYWGYLGYFFSRYGSFDLSMGLLVNIFGYDSFYFYLTSYVLRLIASVSLYPLVSYLTKSKTSAFFASVFFSVSATGLEATNWVFNMPSFLAISFSNLFFLFLIKSKFEQNYKFFAISLIFFSLAILTVFIRMTGLIPTVILLFIFWFLKKPSKVFLKSSIKQISSIILTFILLVSVGTALVSLSSGTHMTGSLQNWSNLGGGSLSSMSTMIRGGNIEFLSYPLLMVGNMIFPIEITQKNKWLLTFSGFGLLVLGLILIKLKWNDNLISTGIFLSLTWIIMSFFFAWIRTPDLIFPFSHRYFIVSAAGLSIFLAILVSLKNIIFKVLIIVLAIFLLVLNIYSSRKYLTNLVENSHGAQISEKIWSQFPHFPQIGETAQPLVFYFEGEERGIMHGVITFGFPFHMGLLYQLDDYNKMPLPMDEWKSLVLAVKNGESLIPYGHPAKPLPIENVYAFKLEGKDHLINITDEVRSRLQSLKEHPF